MTTGDWFFIIATGGGLLIMLLFWLTAHLAHKDGFNAGREYERNRRNTRALEAARTPPTRLLVDAAPEWQVYQPGRHAPFHPRVTVTRDTLSFAGGPATVPINGRSDSGELRALMARADDYITGMQARETTYRRQQMTVAR